MNKKDLSSLRSQFKTDSNYLNLSQLYTVYIKKDNLNIIHSELTSLDMKDDAEKEIYLANFKKLLTGGLDSKVFEMPFDNEAYGSEGQDLCIELLNSDQESFTEICDKFISKIADNYEYETDMVISFVRGKYNKPVGKKSRRGEEESLDGFDETTYGFSFIMCSANKVDSAKRNIYFDASTRRLEMSSSLNKVISFQAPADGFMFPAFIGNCADVNKIIYYTSKSNLRNESLLSNVLNCKYELTAKEEQEMFEDIIRDVNGDTIKPEVIRDIYTVINERIEAQEESDTPVTLNSYEIRDIFQECGVNNLDKFEETFKQKTEEGFEFKAASVVPGSSKTIKISAGTAEISIAPDDLGVVRQVINSRGRKCLQIELSEDAAIGGFTLETEGI